MSGRRDDLVRALEEARRRGGVSRADAEALAGLGIDVAEIVARVEQTHGQGAPAGAGRRRRWWAGSGHRPFTREAKAVLERSLKSALGRGDRHVGDAHILPALADGPGAAARRARRVRGPARRHRARTRRRAGRRARPGGCRGLSAEC
ncbi:hypothetical protein [Streptomyces sp. GC420]|uniref:hypothetical protein n=1 Tax=Streptomyces sp. GC420 TaxID=2697568 RepID=UPI0014152B2B|nr:hypothetical protein [Streptomyces sp. GC420]